MKAGELMLGELTGEPGLSPANRQTDRQFPRVHVCKQEGRLKSQGHHRNRP